MSPSTPKSNIISITSKSKVGREETLERLYANHKAALRSFLWARLGSVHEANDVIQEVFAKLANLEELTNRLPEGHPTNRAFLLTIANNISLNRHKHQTVHNNYVEHVISQQGIDESNLSPDPQKIVSSYQDIELVERAIEKMKPNWRKAFIMNRFSHKTYRQIAIEMEVSVKQVEKYMKNALIELRRVYSAQRGHDS